MSYTLTKLNQMSQAQFVDAVGDAFEATPMIAHTVWWQRPFADVAELHQSMVTVVNAMPRAAQLALIQAHPDLGARVKMAEASVKEQSGAGLDRLSAAEFDQFQRLNQQYKAKFGIPFIIAVKNHTKASILDAFRQRLRHSTETELDQALLEISQIAKFRLFEWVQ